MFSYTRLDLFVTCPRAYYFRYVEGLEEPPSRDAEFGKAVHAVIAGYLRGEGSVAELSKKAVSSSPLLEEEDASEISDMASAFFKRFSPSGRVEVEKKLTASLDGGAELLGYADIVEVPDGPSRGLSVPVITDLKTGWDVYDPLDTMQLPLYAWMLASSEGFKAVRVRFWFLRYRKEPVREQLITPDLQEEAVSWVKERISEICSSESLPGWAGFPERPGKRCASCGFASACLGLPSASSPEEAAALALRLESALELLKRRLKDSISSTGSPVSVGGEHFFLWPKSSWKFPDVGAFASLLEASGHDPWQYLSVDGFKLKRLLRDAAFAERVRAIGEEKKSVYFGHRSNPPDEEALSVLKDVISEKKS